MFTRYVRAFCDNVGVLCMFMVNSNYKLCLLGESPTKVTDTLIRVFDVDNLYVKSIKESM